MRQAQAECEYGKRSSLIEYKTKGANVRVEFRNREYEN